MNIYLEKASFTTLCLLLGLAAGCQRGHEVMLSAPTEPPESILKPVLLSSAPAAPSAVEKPISAPEGSGEAPVQVVKDESSAQAPSSPSAPAISQAPKSHAEGEILKPASTGLTNGKGQPIGGKDKYIHICRSGDTTESVAQAYEIDEKVLLSLNNLRAGSSLSAGKALLLKSDTSKISQSPDVTTYTVAPGDTFSKIARTFGISSTALMKINGAQSSSLQIGDVLIVPQK